MAKTLFLFLSGSLFGFFVGVIVTRHEIPALSFVTHAFNTHALFATAFFLLILFIEFGVLHYAYEKIGLRRHYLFAILMASFLTSDINIPITLNYGAIFSGDLGTSTMQSEGHSVTLAINLGGALIPTLLSLYLLLIHDHYWRSIATVSVASIIVYFAAYPVDQVGIMVPIYVSPLIAAAVVLMTHREYSAPMAYIAGSLGTLIGADLLYLKDLESLRGSFIAIGGEGKSDAIFFTGIFSVLLASMSVGRKTKGKRKDD